MSGSKSILGCGGYVWFLVASRGCGVVVGIVVNGYTREVGFHYLKNDKQQLKVNILMLHITHLALSVFNK